jgi:anti-sigma factor RsiW
MDHIPEEVLEEYANGNLPESDKAEVEEHLVACEFCQDRLEIEDENFIATLREKVALRKKAEPRRRTASPGGGHGPA